MNTNLPPNPNKNMNTRVEDKKYIYLAGGCFWGLEAYMRRVPGVIEVSSGYANGNTENPSYEDVCSNTTGFAETVKVGYDGSKIDLRKILVYYFRVIDPTSLNKQGNDVGSQYRTGIYYVEAADLPIIEAYIAKIAKHYDKKIRVEVEPLKNFYEAEEYHQLYLEKNPRGYCHINLAKVLEPIVEDVNYHKKDIEELQSILTPQEFKVTQEAATDAPFSHKYDGNFKVGIYVDKTTGEPLFISTHKFESGCGWPSFSKPINPEVVKYYYDSSHGMERIEVRSRVGNAHLGHVFEDGPRESGGLRYCINGSSLTFIPVEEMEAKGYGDLIPYCKS